jgi:hypothetical protein
MSIEYYINREPIAVKYWGPEGPLNRTIVQMELTQTEWEQLKTQSVTDEYENDIWATGEDWMVEMLVEAGQILWDTPFRRAQMVRELQQHRYFNEESVHKQMQATLEYLIERHKRAVKDSFSVVRSDFGKRKKEK